MIEIWKQIKGFEGHYEISNLGRLKSFKKNKVRITKGNKTVYGYLSVGLFLSNKSKPSPMHRLVAEAFCEKPVGANIVNHKNKIKTDNRSENLEWCTIGENIKHARRHANFIMQGSREAGFSSKIIPKIQRIVLL